MTMEHFVAPDGMHSDATPRIPRIYVRRAIEGDNPLVEGVVDGVVHAPENELDPASIFPGPRLLNNSDIRILLKRCNYTPEELSQKIEELTLDLPSHISGHLGDPVHFRSESRVHDTMHFIGAGFSIEGRSRNVLEHKVHRDRITVFRGIGAGALIASDFTPHVSLFKTYDEEVANDVVAELKSAHLEDEKVWLGVPQTLLRYADVG